MDVESSTTHLLHGMRLVNRRTGEHTGPCPHCQAGTNRYHIWTESGVGGRSGHLFLQLPRLVRKDWTSTPIVMRSSIGTYHRIPLISSSVRDESTVTRVTLYGKTWWHTMD
jgi:hypothetical protein